MTTPPPSEGPCPEEVRAEFEALAADWLNLADGMPVTSQAESLVRLFIGVRDFAIKQAKRSAHLEDARAGCRYCRNRTASIVSDTPVHDGEQWVHLRRADLQPWESCERPEVWDALSLPPGGQTE